MSSGRPSALHKKFKEVKIHTSKCDECNQHNRQIIYRCLTCSQQCCTPCWIKKGSDGKHVINSDSLPSQAPEIIPAPPPAKRKPKTKPSVTTDKPVKKTEIKKETDDANVAMSDIETEIKSTDRGVASPAISSSKKSHDTPKPSRDWRSVMLGGNDEDPQPVPSKGNLVPADALNRASKPTRLVLSAPKIEPAIFKPINKPTPSQKPNDGGKHHSRKRKSESNPQLSKLGINDEPNPQDAAKRHQTQTVPNDAYTQSYEDQDAEDTQNMAKWLVDFSRDAFRNETSLPSPISGEHGRAGYHY